MSKLENTIIMLGQIGTHFRKMRYVVYPTTKDKICGLCRKPFVKDDPIYLLINNGKLFPNVLIHVDCCEKYGKSKTVRILKRDYDTALFFKHWFV